MKSKSKVTFLIASVITAILLAVSVIIVGFSFGWFTDSKGADVTIKVGAIKNTVTSSDEISPADFVACNYFEKTITIKVESDFEVYLRTYAKVSMQTNDGERTNLVSLIDVDKSKIGEDNKYYYTNSTSSPVTINGTLTLSLTFRFYVDSSVSNELFADSNGTLNENLKTTITYYYEYCQKEGYDSWASNLKTTDGHKYVVSFNANGGTSDYRSKLLEHNETFSALPNATKEGYTFDGWYTEDGTHVTTTTIYAYTTNLTLYARYTAKTYTITFVNYNGKVLKTVSAETGAMPEAPTTNPTKPSTVEYDYTFGGWSPAISKVTGDKVYTAIYNQTLKKYKITFVDEDGTTVLQAEKEYYYGETPVYSGATPTKAQDDDYTYEFNGFGTITQVTGDKTYVARYTAVPLPSTAEFASTWKNLNFASIDSSITNISQLTKLDFKRNAPLGYTKSSLSLNNISVYYNPSAKTEIAFVYKGTILAPAESNKLFANLTNLKNINFDNFNTDNVTTMASMFDYDENLVSIDLTNFNTENVIDFGGMFYYNHLLTKIAFGPKFITTNAVRMSAMFVSCFALTDIDLSNFDTSKVTALDGMFNACFALTSLDLSTFTIKSGCNVDNMIANCNNLTKIIAPKTIDSSISVSLPILFTIFGTETNTSALTNDCATKTLLKATKTTFPSTWKNDITWSSINSSLSSATSVTKIAFEKTAPTGYIDSEKTINGIKIYYNGTAIAFVFDGTIYAPTSCSSLFASLSSLAEIKFNNFDTSKVTNMYSMFEGCSSLKILDLSKFVTTKTTEIMYMFSNCSSLTSLNLSGFNTSEIINMNYLFNGCSSLTSLNLSSFNTSKVQAMSNMFKNCSSLISLDISNFDTSVTTNLRSIFNNCSSLTNLNISNFTINSNCVVNSMFDNCTNLLTIVAPKKIAVVSSYDINLPYLFTIDGTDTITQALTKACAGKTLIKTTEVTFSKTWRTDIDWKALCTSKNSGSILEDDDEMLMLGDISFEKSAPNGYLDSGESINGIKVYYKLEDKTIYLPGGIQSQTFNNMLSVCFVYAETIISPSDSSYLFGINEDEMSGNIIILNCGKMSFNNFDTSKVTNMSYMFRTSYASSFDFSNFVTSKVTDMAYMFYNAVYVTNLDITNFDTSKVKNMNNMFNSTNSLQIINLSNMVINTTNVSEMFMDSPYLETIITPKSIIPSASIALPKSYYINGVGTTTISKLTSSETGCTLYTTPQPAEFSSSWKNLDFTTIDSTITDLTKITKLSFEKTAPSGYTKSILNVNGIELWYNPSVKTELAFVNAGTIYAPAICNFLFSSDATSGRLTSLLNLTFNNFDTSKVTEMGYMFAYCSSLTSLNLGDFDTSNVVRMYYMFGQCSSLTSVDVSKFDTSNVTSVDYMFAYCSSLTSLNVSSFNTSKAKGFSDMFRNCSSLTSLDISNFNTSRASTMRDMFYYCSSLTSLNLSNFDTSNVIDMYSMFAGCSKLTSLNISSFNTTKVTNMYDMFYQCSSLTSLNLSNFDTSKVTTMYEMFYNCSSLTSLNLSKFNTTNVTTMYGMFRNCSSLASLNLSNFNTSKVTDMSYMFFGCTAFTSLDLSNFNTSKVTDMRYMFYNCLSLTSLNLSNFTINSGCTVSSFLSGCTNLTTIVAPNTIDSSISITLPKTFTVSGTSTTINKLTSDYAGKTLTR